MFATGPRAVGFTIVWPEGVIFRSMMTYHVQFLLLVLAGWVNRQQQDVIDYQQEAAIWMTLLAWTVRSLGRHRCDRPVHRRGCEPVRARPLPCPVCHRYRHSLRVHRWDNVGPQRGVDEAGGKKPH